MVDGEAGRAGGNSTSHGGAHFPLCVFTDNVSRRTPAKLAQRRERVRNLSKRCHYYDDADATMQSLCQSALNTTDENEQTALEQDTKLMEFEDRSSLPVERGYYWPQPLMMPCPGQNTFTTHWDDKGTTFSYQSGMSMTGSLYHMYMMETPPLD